MSTVLHRHTPLQAHPRHESVTLAQLLAWFSLPLNDLLFQAQQIHRQHFDPNAIQLSSLVSVKTGGCSEDCGYCPQSAHHEGGVDKQTMMSTDAVVAAAKQAKANGAGRFCMGAAWRSPNERDLAKVIEMVREVRALGLETCATLGMLKEGQAEQLKAAGLDYYNHNLDTAPEKYGDIIHTRTYEDRLDTLAKVRQVGLHVCCGGIVGMGESREQRAALILELASLNPAPESVPINHLVRVEGTPLAEAEPLDPLEFVRTIAVTRLALPQSWVRLSAGREALGEAVQALCFLAGANSIFYGEKLLTTDNAEASADRALFAKLGLYPAA